MATLTLTKNYADATLLLAADFDVFLDELETFLNTTKLNDDNIQNDGITGSSKIASATISAAKLASNSVVTTGIEDQAITADKINASAVTTAKIADLAVTTAKIADANVTTAKIADANVTRAKLRAVNIAVSSATSSSYTSTGLSLVATASLTTTGRPVLLMLESGDGATSSYVELGSDYTAVTTARAYCEGIFYRDASAISASVFADTRKSYSFPSYDGVYQTTSRPPSMFTHIEQPAAGTYTYSFYFNNPLATQRVKWANVRLVAVEL